MVRKLLNDPIVYTLGKICSHTERTGDMPLYSVTIFSSHIISFPDHIIIVILIITTTIINMIYSVIL